MTTQLPTTITTTTCTLCGGTIDVRACRSAAGWYVGYWCDNCGPYSRESGYYGTKKAAEKELAILYP